MSGLKVVINIYGQQKSKTLFASEWLLNGIESALRSVDSESNAARRKVRICSSGIVHIYQLSSQRMITQEALSKIIRNLKT